MRQQKSFQSRCRVESTGARFVACSLLLVWLSTVHTTAQGYRVLHHFQNGGITGYMRDAGALVPGPDEILYGTTLEEVDPSSVGSVFKIKTDGTAFMVLKPFDIDTPDDGAFPSRLLLSDTVLYGITLSGFGSNSSGTVFRLNTDGSDFRVLKRFNESDGGMPNGLVLGGSTLYGSTQKGGGSGRGVLFKLNVDGSEFAVLKSFSGGDGATPGELLLSGTTLYGVTWNGGDFDKGTVFSIQTDGTGHRVLKNLSGAADGAGPVGRLLLSGNTLFGTAREGAEGCGTVFKLDTAGSGFTVLKTFVGADGCRPGGGLILYGDFLLGTTSSGGPFNDGTVFALGTSGNTFAVLKGLGDVDGSGPEATLCLPGLDAYGTTQLGGNRGAGVVFGISVAPASLVKSPSSQTAEIGSGVCLSVHASGAEPLNYDWLFNDSAVGCDPTNSALELTSAQPSDIGAYTVRVTNFFGAVTSTPAMLNVIAPVSRRLVPGVLAAGEGGGSLNVDCADAFGPAAHWQLVDSVGMASPSQWCFDLSTPLPPQRFYRAWQTGAPSVIPSLELHEIPALMLTGDASSKVRVDGINAIGPTDAWFTLDTVTLTNTSQLYFDVSVIGQPRRLYRLVPVP